MSHDRRHAHPTGRQIRTAISILLMLATPAATMAQSGDSIATWPAARGQPLWLDGRHPIQFPNSDDLDLPNGSPWTLEAWVYPQHRTEVHVAGKRAGCGPGGGFYQLAIARNPGGMGMGIDPSYVPLNTWSHVVISADGANGWVAYANGALVHKAYRPRWHIRNNGLFKVGGSGTCAGFVGGLERLTLYRRALTSEEVRAEYESHRAEIAKLGPPAPLPGTGAAENQSPVNGTESAGAPSKAGPAESSNAPLTETSCGDPVGPHPLDPWDARFTPPPGSAYAADIARADEYFRARKYSEAGKLYLTAGYAKDPYASRRLGLIFLYGLAGTDASFESNPNVAAIFFRQAAEQGDVASARMLGWMSTQGIGTRKDFAQARALFESGAKIDYPEAEIALGVMLARGDGVSPDYQEAMRWYRRAVSHRDPNGWVGVASLHEDGLGVEQSDAEAMRLYRRASDEGSASGARNVARMYENGIGVPSDLSLALCWYRKAADAGDGAAMNRLAVWLDQRHRFPEALNWFLKGADAGNPDAMYNVGRYRAGGIAGPKSADWESGMWFGRAEALGHPQAASVMDGRRRAVAGMLTFAYVLITAPPPPPRCYKAALRPSQSRYLVPCTGDYDYKVSGW